jgi:hypothetical protein
MAAASRKGSSSIEGTSAGDGKEEPVRCGECRKLVMDKGIHVRFVNCGFTVNVKM